MSTQPPDKRDAAYDDYVAERDFERRYGKRAGGANAVAEAQGRFAERRSWWERTSDEVSSWFGDQKAMKRRQWDEAVGDQTGKGPRISVDEDTRILAEINQRMTNDAMLDATGVEVQVLAGEVMLTGRVITSADKRRAEEVSEAVQGVVQVRNNLQVA